MEKRIEKTINGKKFYLTKQQIKFKAKEVVITKPVKVISFLSVQWIPIGTILKTRPLYKDVLGTALSGEENEVYVALGENSSCWIPNGHWKINSNQIPQV